MNELHVIYVKDRLFHCSRETIVDDCKRAGRLINEGWTWFEIDRLCEQMRSTVYSSEPVHYIRVDVTREVVGQTRLRFGYRGRGDKYECLAAAERHYKEQYDKSWSIDVKIVSASVYASIIEASQTFEAMEESDA